MKTPKAHVFLDPDGMLGMGLIVIVEAPTGVVYQQQCAGFATQQRSLEGFLIPVGSPAQGREIYDWFWKTFHGWCFETLSAGNPWNPDTTATLQELVANIPCWHTTADGESDERHFLRLDAERMAECVEAWIPVVTPYGRGILTLENSD